MKNEDKCQRSHPHEGECAGVELEVGDEAQAFGFAIEKGEYIFLNGDRVDVLSIPFSNQVKVSYIGQEVYLHPRQLKLIRKAKKPFKWSGEGTINQECLYLDGPPISHEHTGKSCKITIEEIEVEE